MRERLDPRCVARAARCGAFLHAARGAAARRCSQLQFMPAYERPAAPVPATYPEVAAAGSATPAPAPTAASADLGWREFSPIRGCAS